LKNINYIKNDNEKELLDAALKHSGLSSDYVHILKESINCEKIKK
jgi:hypothetical protein